MRLATITDISQIETLMRVSGTELFPRFYTTEQAASAAIYLTEPDVTLVNDGTYFVHEVHKEIVACGGWSKRNKLYTGSGAQEDDGRMLDPATEPARVRAMFVRADWTRRGLAKQILDGCVQAARTEGFRSLSLMATLPGVPLYRSYGFEETRKTMVRMPDGVQLEGVEMTYEL
ncbi:GNAT family N-acetyltransferase [Kibdelosporangium philippinense]|uniref:GNAT family N-acetyltransferase n=1 Tax=Kibdelosporangium philippinense TaxID=211113 RepID=A0ABS8ZTW7_9PSEU|nr:GNAT family N-acetyltransferase [Kibdelosporangium philippinense]MCE7011132.1 GNAT family N-acetyltransferase [Kibdelosporangium philippinense]